MANSDLFSGAYQALLQDLKQRIQSAQLRASVSVNRELVLLYWSIGREILLRQAQENWGTKVLMTTHTTAPASTGDANGQCEFRKNGKRLGQRQPSRAAHRSRNSEISGVLGVEADRFDHELEFVGPVNPARHPVGHAGPDELVLAKARGR